MWGWVERLRQFINRLTNSVLRRKTLNQVVDANILAHQGDVVTLNERLADDAITISEWETAMRTEIKNAVIQQYLLGRGGSPQLTAADYGSIGGMLSDQYRYLSDFARQIANGELSLAMINRRSVMYISSSREAFARANARAYGVPLERLPAFPGDGKSCLGLTNCGCMWVFEEKPTQWNCYWRLGQTEHCALCVEHAQQWNPYVVSKETTKASGIITRPSTFIFGGVDHPERVVVTPLKESKPIGISWKKLQSRFSELHNNSGNSTEEETCLT